MEKFAALLKQLGARETIDLSLLQGGALEAARHLFSWGGASQHDGKLDFNAPFDAAVLTLFAPLLDQLDPVVVDIAPEGMPAVLKAAFPGKGASFQAIDTEVLSGIVSGGQGVHAAQAMVSCLGEMAERISLVFQGKHDPRIADAGQAGGSLDPSAFLGFSAEQERALCRSFPELAGFRNTEGRLCWKDLDGPQLCVTDLADGGQWRLPAWLLLLGADAFPGAAGLGLSSTIGAAVWASPEGARHRGLLELLERDSVARAWYNRLGISVLSEQSWPQVFLPKMQKYLSARARKTWILCLQSDFAVHVAMAISHESGGVRAAMGSAARLSFPQAVQSAVGEMLQAERAQELTMRARQKAQERGEEMGPVPSFHAYGQQHDIAADLALEGAPRIAVEELMTDYEPDDPLKSCLAQGIRLYAFDATLPGLDIPCIRVLSPDLCTWQARWGQKRLCLGEVSEADLQDRAFPF